jgi:dynactin-4
VRYKIKLVAGNYLPAITVALPHAQRTIAEAAKRSLGKSTSGPSPEEDKAAAGLHAGKTYQFHLALVNPLYDPITVRLSPQRMSVSTAGGVGGTSEKARRPPFAISLPNQVFSVAAFAEAWEYDDDEEMFGVEDEELGLRSGKDVDGRGGKVRTVGVLEKRANTTIIGGEVVIGKEARGNVKVSRLRCHELHCMDRAD